MKLITQLCFEKKKIIFRKEKEKLKLSGEHKVWGRKPYFHFKEPLQTK